MGNGHKNFQKILYVAVLILMGTIVYSLTVFPSSQVKIDLADYESEGQERAFVSKVNAAQPFDDYVQILRSRHIFQLPDQETVQNRSENSEYPQHAGTSGTDVFAVNNFKLVGVLIDASPRAVIEDIEKKETLFLKRGDVINGMRVEDIEHGKVIVDSGGKKISINAE